MMGIVFYLSEYAHLLVEGSACEPFLALGVYGVIRHETAFLILQLDENTESGSMP